MDAKLVLAALGCLSLVHFSCAQSTPDLPYLPVLSTEWELLTTGNEEDVGVYRLGCSFEEPTDTNRSILFEVVFYVENPDTGIKTDLLKEEKDNGGSVYLRSDLVVKENLQQDLRCQVRGAWADYTDFPLWGTELYSEALFLGLKIIETRYTINIGADDTSVLYHFTMPITCNGTSCMDPMDEQCFVDVNFICEIGGMKEQNTCTNTIYRDPILVHRTTCMARIPCERFHHVRVHIVRVKDTLQNGVPPNDFDMYAVTRDYTRPSWHNIVTSTHIRIRNNLNNGDVKRHRCTSNNDPHITSFMGSKYDVHIQGEYVLYKTEPGYDPTALALVTARYDWCNPGNTNIACNVAVGLRNRNEAVIIDRNRIPELRYLGSGEGDRGFRVVRKNRDKYEAFFPGGEIVTISISNRKINIALNSPMDVQLYEQPGNGLCGDIPKGSRDLVFRNGTEHREPNKQWERMPSFSNDWFVREAEEVIYSAGLPPVAPPNPLNTWYACSVDTLDDFLDAKEDIEFEEDLPKEPCYPKNGPNEDNVLDDLREEGPQPSYPAPDDSYEYSNTVDWTLEETQAWCFEYIGLSPVAWACNQTQPEDVINAVSECVQDIQESKTTDWAEGTLDALREKCKMTIFQDLDMWRENADGEFTPWEELMDRLCPWPNGEKCSGHGECAAGVCICDEGWVRDDCSLHIDTAPTLQGAAFGRVCDAANGTCSVSLIQGDDFADVETLTCHIETEDGQSHVYQPGVMVNMDVVGCTLPLGPQSTSPYTIYKLGISNNGHVLHMSETIEVAVIREPCAYCEESEDFGVVCGYAADSCWIDNMCVAEGKAEPGDKCSQCVPGVNQEAYSNVNNCGKMSDAAIAGTVAGIGLLALVVIGLLVRGRKKEVVIQPMMYPPSTDGTTQPSKDAQTTDPAQPMPSVQPAVPMKQEEV